MILTYASTIKQIFANFVKHSFEDKQSKHSADPPQLKTECLWQTLLHI